MLKLAHSGRRKNDLEHKNNVVLIVDTVNRESRGSGFWRFDLHQTLTEPDDLPILDFRLLIFD